MQHARASFSLSVPRTRNTTISTRLLLFCISGIYIYIYTRLYIIIIPSLLPASFTSITMQLRNSVSTIYPNCASKWKCVETISLLSLRGMILSYIVSQRNIERNIESFESIFFETICWEFFRWFSINWTNWIIWGFLKNLIPNIPCIVNNTKFTK